MNKTDILCPPRFRLQSLQHIGSIFAEDKFVTWKPDFLDSCTMTREREDASIFQDENLRGISCACIQEKQQVVALDQVFGVDLRRCNGQRIDMLEKGLPRSLASCDPALESRVVFLKKRLLAYPCKIRISNESAKESSCVLLLFTPSLPGTCWGRPEATMPLCPSCFS